MKPDTSDALFEILLNAAKKVSMGAYDQTNSLMELTNQDKYPALVSQLAEAFGMMIVQVEARELNLEQLLDQLKIKNKKQKTRRHPTTLNKSFAWAAPGSKP